MGNRRIAKVGPDRIRRPGADTASTGPAGRIGVGPDELHDVRFLQPYQAVKRYRCPGCGHEIPAGKGHLVVVPRDEPDLRRHWHTPCWQARHRRHPR